MGIVAPNGEPVTKEMLEGADLYWDAISEHNSLPSYSESSLHIEVPIDISNILPGMKGTPDVWFTKDTHLYLYDYKFGHSYIEVFENWQLLEYAAGICLDKDITAVTMIIVQPRCYTSQGQVRSWTIKAPQMLEYIKILQRAEQEAISPSAAQRPNSQCHHCSGRHACQALQQVSLNAIDVSMDNSPWELSPLSTGNELRYLKRAAELLEARITGLSKQARSMITRGEFVPWFKLEPTAGREKWLRDAEENYHNG